MCHYTSIMFLRKQKKYPSIGILTFKKVLKLFISSFMNSMPPMASSDIMTRHLYDDIDNDASNRMRYFF